MGVRGVSTHSNVLGVLFWEKWSRNRGQLSGMGKDGRGRGAKVQPGDGSSEPPSEREPWAGGGPEPSPSALRQASPCLCLHYMSSASSPSLGAQSCTETWGLGFGRGRDSRVLLVPAHSGHKAPWNPVFPVENHPWYKKTSGAPCWQLCVNNLIPGALRPTLTRSWPKHT